LAYFFDFLELQGTTPERAKLFLDEAKKNGLEWTTSQLMRYIMYQKSRADKKEITPATIKNYYKPVKLFLEMNNIELSWKKISRGIPRGRRYAIDRAPTIEEIHKIINHPDRRIRGIVFTMCSSAMRLGAWDYLKWQDITPIQQDNKIVAAKIVIYSGDADEYFSFITPEAYYELKKWIDFRSQNGENISGKSWVMRDIWNIEKHARGFVSTPKQLKSAGIKRLIERALHMEGVRTVLPEGQRRHEFQADHGFRKFFNTHAEQTMKPINVEILMGHSIGISDSYYRPSENTLLEDYLKAIPDLTISKEYRSIMDADKLRAHGSGIEENRTEIEHLKEEIRRIKLRNEIGEALKQGLIESVRNDPGTIQPIQIAMADFTKPNKTLDEITDHILKEHNGDISGLKERFSKAKITIIDD
jgi:integrase